MLADKVSQLRPVVREYIHAKVRRADVAEDLAQDTCVTALAKLGDLRDAEKLQAWLKQIALNKTRDWLRRQKTQRWNALADEAYREDGTARRDLFEEIDEVVARLSGVDASPVQLAVLLLHYLFEMTPKEIEAAANIRLSTVYSCLQRARSKAGVQTEPAMDVERAFAMKYKLCWCLWNAGFRPASGEAFRNSELIKSTYHFVRLMRLQYPKRHEFYYANILFACALTQLAEYEDDFEMERGAYEWNRGKWDRSYLEEARELYDIYEAMEPPRRLWVVVESIFNYMIPECDEDVDARRSLDLILEAVQLNPRSLFYRSAAQLICRVEGPRVAARYLEQFVSHPVAKASPMFHVDVGRYNLLAGNWKQARRFFKKAMHWKWNESQKNYLTRQIRECSKRSRG